MQQLTDIKQVRGNTGQKLSDLLIIKKRKLKLLIMLKNFVSHVVLNLCTHDMSIVGNIKIAEAL